MDASPDPGSDTAEPTSEFDDPRVAELYDLEEGFRSDLVPYVEMVDRLGARTVLDVGCGTGVLAHMLAERGIDVVGVEPAAAMLDRARRAGSDRVRWVHGYVEDALPLQVDVVTLTANTAMTFESDDEWTGMLAACRSALVDGGHLIFEYRVREREAWRNWTASNANRFETERYGSVSTWSDVRQVRQSTAADVVTFVETARLGSGETIERESTLVFRSRASIEAALAGAGFEVVSIGDAPDRPGREWVFVCRSGDL